MMLSGRRRRPVTRKKIHKIMHTEPTQVIKNDRAQPCDNTDKYKI